MKATRSPPSAEPKGVEINPKPLAEIQAGNLLIIAVYVATYANRAKENDPAIAADFRDQFPVPAKLWTIADLGGWSTVDPQLFDKTNGSITKIYTQATG